MPARACTVALLLAALLAGCGSGGGKPQAGLTNGQRQALIVQLEAVRASAASGDLPGAETAIARFRASVARLRLAGALSDDAARLLRIGAERVIARVKSDSAPPQPTSVTPTATTPAPAPPPPQKKKPGKPHPPGHDKHGKHGKGPGDGEGGD